MSARTASTTSMVLVPGWRWTASTTARSSLNQLATLSFSTPSMTLPISSEAHRRAVAVGDDERPVGGGVHELARRLHGEGLLRSVERAGRHVDVAAHDGLLDFVDADATRGEGPRVHLDAHGVLLRPEDEHLRDAADHRDPLGQVVCAYSSTVYSGSVGELSAR